MADETTTTTASSSIRSEIFAGAMRMYPRLRSVAVAFAWQEMGKSNVPISFTRLNTSTVIAAGTKTEGASFTRYSQATAATQVTPAFVGSELVLTDEVVMAVENGDFSARVIQDRVRALYARIGTDLLATISGSTNTYGSTATTFTREAAMNAIAQYWGLYLDDSAEEHAMILSNAAAGHFGVDTLTTSATVAEARNRFGTNQILGEFNGFLVARDPACPAEGVGYSSCITPVGNGASGLLIGVSESVNARPQTRGSEGERDAESHQVVRAMYGVNDDDGFYLEVQTAA